MNWKLFALHGDIKSRLHDIRFVIPAGESAETTIEAHTERLNELKNYFEQATNQRVATKYSLTLLAETCICFDF